MTSDKPFGFSKESLHKFLYQEARRRTYDLEYFHWSWGESSFLVQEEELEIYIGAKRKYNSIIHFYCRTVLHMLGYGRDNQDSSNPTLQVPKEELQHWLSHYAPSSVEVIQESRYNEVTHRVHVALPSKDVVGDFQSALTIGPCDWESTVVLVQFEHSYMLVDLANLA
ncbi:hypothetical protein [Deinococcus sedimenti]|nr:hypothetical protein [Deinococcus sedimenti]